MESQVNVAEREEIQVYRNDFVSGMILLVKKLFSL
jgi:hypothetical protein